MRFAARFFTATANKTAKCLQAHKMRGFSYILYLSEAMYAYSLKKHDLPINSRRIELLGIASSLSMLLKY